MGEEATAKDFRGKTPFRSGNHPPYGLSVSRSLILGLKGANDPTAQYSNTVEQTMNKKVEKMC